MGTRGYLAGPAAEVERVAMPWWERVAEEHDPAVLVVPTMADAIAHHLAKGPPWTPSYGGAR